MFNESDETGGSARLDETAQLAEKSAERDINSLHGSFLDAFVKLGFINKTGKKGREFYERTGKLESADKEGLPYPFNLPSKLHPETGKLVSPQLDANYTMGAFTLQIGYPTENGGWVSFTVAPSREDSGRKVPPQYSFQVVEAGGKKKLTEHLSKGGIWQQVEYPAEPKNNSSGPVNFRIDPQVLDVLNSLQQAARTVQKPGMFSRLFSKS